MAQAVSAAVRVALIIVLAAPPVRGETLRWGRHGEPGWWYTDEPYGSNKEGSVMLAGNVFSYSSEEARGIPLYFFCNSEPGPWESLEGGGEHRFITRHFTMLFQPPSKYAVPSNSGREYRFTLYSDGGMGRGATGLKLNVRVPALDEGRVERVKITDRVLDALYRTRDYLHI
jgi:hypothetical protein